MCQTDKQLKLKTAIEESAPHKGFLGKSFNLMETLERVRSGGRMPLLILGEGGRWQRLEDEWSDLRTEKKLEKQSGGGTDHGRTDIEAGLAVETQKDQSGSDHCLKPEYSKAPARIKSKTASPRIFSKKRRALTAGFSAQITVYHYSEQNKVQCSNFYLSRAK